MATALIFLSSQYFNYTNPLMISLPFDWTINMLATAYLTTIHLSSNYLFFLCTVDTFDLLLSCMYLFLYCIYVKIESINQLNYTFNQNWQTFRRSHLLICEDLLLFFILYNMKLNLWVLDFWLDKTSSLETSPWTLGTGFFCHYFQPFYRTKIWFIEGKKSAD